MGRLDHPRRHVTEGERVIVLARDSARNKATGKSMEARVAHSFIVRAGQIVGMEQIVDSWRTSRTDAAIDAKCRLGR